jgi:hypothetical protein
MLTNPDAAVQGTCTRNGEKKTELFLSMITHILNQIKATQYVPQACLRLSFT